MSGIRLVLRAAFAGLLAFGWLLLALGFVGLFYRPNTQIPEDLPGRQVLLRGLPVRVVQSGQGRDVLLIHGSPGSLEDWEPLKRALEGSFRVTAYDRPGHGWSGDTGAYSPQANADAALSLIETLDLHDVIVVGHSYGGAIALALALRASPRVSAYAVLDSALYSSIRKPVLLYHVLAWPLVGVGSASVIAPFLAPLLIRSGITQAFGPRGKAPSEDFIAVRTHIWSTPKVLHAAALESLRSDAALATLSPRYASIRAPVTIMAQTDDAQRRASAEQLHREVADSTLKLLRGTGHYLQIEKTREVADEIYALALRSSDAE